MIIVESKIGETIQIGSGVPPTRIAPNFNGISQYGVIPDIELQINDIVTFDFIAPTQLSTSIRMMLSSSEAFTTIMRVEPSGELVSAESFTVDGVTQTQIPLDGLIHTIEVTMLKARLLNLVAAQSDGAGSFLRFADFPIFNLKINNGSIYNFPMDDGWQNNPTMRNTGSGADGTYINMTEAAWQEITL